MKIESFSNEQLHEVAQLVQQLNDCDIDYFVFKDKTKHFIGKDYYPDFQSSVRFEVFRRFAQQKIK